MESRRIKYFMLRISFSGDYQRKRVGFEKLPDSSIFNSASAFLFVAYIKYQIG